jgi:PAS domain S-box-containing protein
MPRRSPGARKRAEVARHDSEETLRMTLQSVSDAVLVTDMAGRVSRVNPVAERLTGWAAAETAGRPVEEVFHIINEKTQQPATLPVAKVLATGIAQGLADHTVLIARDATTSRAIAGSAAPIRRDEGQVAGVVLVFRGVADERRTQSDMLRINEAQPPAASREPTNKNLRLQHADRLKSEFLANMSHELRTPLNAIIGFSDILCEGLVGPLTPRQREYAAGIHDSGRHLLTLINEILDLSRIETGSMQLENEAVRVSSLLDSCIAVVQEKALARQLDLSMEIDEALGTMEADGGKLTQIVSNLLSNAVKFTDPGGKIGLVARRVARARIATVAADAGRLIVPTAPDDEFLEFAVDDSGIGIAVADQDRLFEPFVQVDSSLTRHHEGSGLGLALVRRLVELHGGGLALASAPGRGSRFTVWVPYREAVERPSEESEPRPTAREVPLALVIEDDDASAHLLMRELESHGITALHAWTAEEGLVLARNRRPDLIVLDIFLPHIDGWQCLDRLKADEQTASIPVVIVTISSEQRRGVTLGAMRVLQKPIARESLLQVLDQLGLNRAPTATVLVADDDPAAVEVAAVNLQSTGLRVLRAYGGREAIDMALSERPALVVLDLMMPQVSGFEVVAALKDSPQGRSIPIVVVTGKELKAEERAQMSGQVLCVMEKSGFSATDFVAEVQRALAGERSGAFSET